MPDKTEKVPFFVPDIGDDEINEVVDSLKNGWVTTGSKAKQFEDNFTAFISGGESKNIDCIAVNSATAGLHLALEAIGIGTGDEVIVPDMTFTATAEVVRYLGADPVFVDCDPKTLNITAQSVAAKITDRTKAIMPVHFGGLPVNMTEILALSRKHGLKVVEDAAHALPAIHNGQMIGTLGSDVTVFSFYANKTITTGEGGMIATTDKDIAARCKVMRLHGIDRDAFDRFSSTKVSWQYDVVAPGYKYNMTDIAASIGIHQLKKAERYQKRRAELAMLYHDQLKNLPLILPAIAEQGDLHSWHLYIIRVTENAPLDRNSLIDALNEAGIKCSVHYTPLHGLTYWKTQYNLKTEDFPNAQKAFETCLTLPLFPLMTNEQVIRVCDTFKRLLG